MFTRHVLKDLSAYCHGGLTAADSHRVAEHLLRCGRCRRSYEEISLGVRLAEHLPLVAAPASLWDEIERLHDARGRSGPRGIARRPSPPGWRVALIAAAIVLTAGAGLAVYRLRPTGDSWQVARLEGAPIVGSDRIERSGRLQIGGWLETDGASRAEIQVRGIGYVEVEPNTRVQLVESHSTEHRLALARGTVRARIWAPPRLFFVDTPSGVAVDYGCAYTLEVDDAGAGLLHVTAGQVALELNGRESFVPAGAACATRPGIGPGTPYFEDAPEALREALARFDFEGGRAEALGIVLAAARERDALTLWYLLARVGEGERASVHDRLAALSPPPRGVTRDRVLRLDVDALKAWRSHISLSRY